MTIRVLDRQTVNQIAAGEVIERPASALKELLENSSDSGATRIEIDFEAGGKKELRVTDDGHGISSDELALALEPHATSKIEKIDDLTRLKTFGFRGEALASMSAVSDLAIHSSLKNSEAGARIVSQAGLIGDATPAPPIKGTQVTVKDLFHNVPARQKFLKSDAGETAAIKKVVRAFALGHPEISLTVRQGGKVIFHWEKEPFFNRACRVMEIERNQALQLLAEDRHMKLEAAIALPECHLPTQQGLWIFVQGRPVNDRTLQQAVFEGYRNLLMQHQYPRAVISLRIDPEQVDVNVHPTKAQVKFTEPGAIFRFVSQSIKSELEKKYSQSSFDSEMSIKKEIPMTTMDLLRDVATQYNQREFESPKPLQVQNTWPTTEPAVVFGGKTAPLEELSGEKSSGSWSSLQIIGQAANTYLMCQSPKAIILIDQHAAHERVLFERIKRQAQEGKVEVQGALLEEIIELPRETIETLTDPKWIPIFQKLGFELIDRGPTSLAVSSRPSFLTEIGLKPLLERVAEQINDSGSAGLLDDLITDIWATMSCHGAIRAGRVLSQSEIKALLEQMDEFAFSSFCPHGRPVSVQWTIRDLEKLFKRIV